MKTLERHFATPRTISKEWREKIFPETPLYNTLMYVWLGGIVLSILCVIFSLFGMSWVYTFVVIVITAFAYIYQKSIEKKAIQNTADYLVNAPFSYMGFCTWWSRIFEGQDGLAVVVYSTNLALAKDYSYISNVRDRVAQLLNNQIPANTKEEKQIYADVRNDEKGRYKISSKQMVPESLGSKGDTYLATVHLEGKNLSNNFNPENQLWGIFLKDEKPLDALSFTILN